MSKIGFVRALFALAAALCFAPQPAQAQFSETFVSHTGSNTNDCATSADPCETLQSAHDKTSQNGTIVIMDSSDYSPVIITKSISIINDSGGTATVKDGTSVNGVTAAIIISAGPSDVVTLRGVTLEGSEAFLPVSGLLVANAGQVNIEHCRIIGYTSGGIRVGLGSTGLAPPTNLNIKIEDTVVTGSNGGAVIAAAPGATVNASIVRSSFHNNVGGIRIDGTNGGTIQASISDTTSSLNAANGVIAISGPGNVSAHITRSTMALNGQFGVVANQARGGSALVTVSASSLANNLTGAVDAVGGGAALTSGNNQVFGPAGTGFTGPNALQ